ncbi:MAG TPA: hypothetical protein VK153_00950 [Candidatus Paceibacterota bacterium]|nr:hypothetical protein [Candidatus Paceibacterota bacterium]
MTTSELISYISKQLKNNVSKDLIISKLTIAGWRKEDIDEGFSIVEKPEPDIFVSTPPVKEEVVDLDEVGSLKNIENNQNPKDKYREPITEDNIFQTESPVSAYNPVSNPSEIKPSSREISNETQESKKMESPVVKEPQKVEIPVVKEEKKEELEMEVSKMELPTGEPSVQAPKIEAIKPEIPKTEPVVEKVMPEIPKVLTPFQAPIKEKTKIEEKVELEVKKPARSATDVAGGEELIPTLNPKPETNPFGYVNVNYPTPPANSSDNKDVAPKISSGQDLSKMAMISSYQKDMLSASELNKIANKNNKFKITKWWIIGIIVIVIIGLGIFAFAGGYLRITNVNFSFIKKDPKVLLLKNSEVLSSLNSYKTETNIEISSPSLSTISYGLVSGEAVPGNEKDSISINVLGKINKNESGLLSDNSITVKGSVLNEDIISDVKNDGKNLFIQIPDFTQILREDITLASPIKLNHQENNLIASLFPVKTEEKLKKVDIYRILSQGVSSYVNEDILTSYNELINNVEVIQKGEENIKGIDTYHYSINADRQLAKDLLIKLSNNFLINLSDEDKNILNEVLGAVRIDSFEVWVGKGDSNIYQYSVAVNVPISKIVGFEDKSIGDNTVSVSWKTTYYDFNVSNEIIIPESSTPMEDFVDSVKELRIKNNVLYFKEAADNLYSIEKSFGVKSNTKGSCMEPVSGSLFSPIGHSKKADSAVGLISWHLKDVLKVTDSNSSCFSTTKAWSFAFLLSTEADLLEEGAEKKTFFCVDSTGANQTINSLPTGVSCSLPSTSQ